MFGNELFKIISQSKILKQIGPDDFADRFMFQFSAMLFVLSSCIISLKQYFMEAISCYLSTHGGGENLIKYVENFCWVHGTIPVNFSAYLPENQDWEKFDKKRITYYQWVPYILATQAFLCYFPQLLWLFLSKWKTGGTLQMVMIAASESVTYDDEEKFKKISKLVKSLEIMFHQNRDFRHGKWSNLQRKINKSANFFVFSKRLGNQLVMSYLIIKLFYFLNGLLQIYYIESLLGFRILPDLLFGIRIINNIRFEHNTEDNYIFSRVTFCVAKVRVFGGMNYAISQCVLPINILNEKIFIFLGIWMLIVTFVTGISFVIWCGRVFFQGFQINFLRRYLKLNSQYKKGEKLDHLIKKFENQFLRNDGMFILRMIALNAGDSVAADVTCQLWEIYREKYIGRNFNCDSFDILGNGNILKCSTRMDLNRTDETGRNSTQLLTSLTSVSAI